MIDTGVTHTFPYSFHIHCLSLFKYNSSILFYCADIQQSNNTVLYNFPSFLQGIYFTTKPKNRKKKKKQIYATNLLRFSKMIVTMDTLEKNRLMIKLNDDNGCKKEFILLCRWRCTVQTTLSQVYDVSCDIKNIAALCHGVLVIYFTRPKHLKTRGRNFLYCLLF